MNKLSQFHEDIQKLQTSAGHSQAEFDTLGQALLDIAEDVTSETCTHPELITLPVNLDRLYSIMCSSCGKTFSLTYSNFLKGIPCVATLVKEEFGPAWEQRAIVWCQCKKHK